MDKKLWYQDDFEEESEFEYESPRRHRYELTMGSHICRDCGKSATMPKDFREKCEKYGTDEFKKLKQKQV